MTHQLEQIDYQRLLMLQRLQNIARPWVVATRGRWGWETRCRFPSLTAASQHAHLLKDAFGYEPLEVTVSSVEDGAELFPLEWAINRAREQRALENGKLNPDRKRLAVLQNEISYIYEEAHLYAHTQGFELINQIRDGLVRLSRGETRVVSMLPACPEPLAETATEVEVK
ncbi:MAG: hypothetical protein ACFB0G_01030 [Leptolyngbyaceae cyanobacterium]